MEHRTARPDAPARGRPHAGRSARSAHSPRSARSARSRAAALLLGVLLLLTAQALSASADGDDGWTGTWAAAPTTVPATAGTVFEDQTLRQVVHTSAAGDTVRVRLSNEFGTAPLVVGEAHVARRADGASGREIAPSTDRTLRFDGRTSVTVPPGKRIDSDAVKLRVPAGADLAVSVHLPRRTPATTVHASAYQQNYVAPGNATGDTVVAETAVVQQWYFLSGVSVSGGRADRAPAVVAFGDSITDGAVTTVNANRRWPDVLAERLRSPAGQRETGRRDTGVLNAGIGGNRLLHDPNPPAGSPAQAYAAYFGESGLKRFDRDVTSQPGARYAIVLLGVNDLGHPGTTAPESERVSAADLIAGHRRLIARAHAHGMKIYGGTITPFKYDTLGFYSPENEAARQRVNRWIRTGGEYDGVIDFDAAVRDPHEPARLLPAYDSGDHLHPNDAGMRAMGEAVPLRLLR